MISSFWGFSRTRLATGKKSCLERGPFSLFAKSFISPHCFHVHPSHLFGSSLNPGDHCAMSATCLTNSTIRLSRRAGGGGGGAGRARGGGGGAGGGGAAGDL